MYKVKFHEVSQSTTTWNCKLNFSKPTQTGSVRVWTSCVKRGYWPSGVIQRPQKGHNLIMGLSSPWSKACFGPTLAKCKNKPQNKQANLQVMQVPGITKFNMLQSRTANPHSTVYHPRCPASGGKLLNMWRDREMWPISRMKINQ